MGGQLHVMVGSADALGNPLKLMDSLRQGVKDLLQDSSVSLQDRVPQPSVIVAAILSGSRSAYLHFSAGVFGLISAVTKTAARGAASLSFDKEFLLIREQERRRFEVNLNVNVTCLTGHFLVWKAEIESNAQRDEDDPRNRMPHMQLGLRRLRMGLLQAGAGIARHPMRGYSATGAVGLAKGFLLGASGIVTKPVAGMLDVVSGSANDASLILRPQARAPPRRVRRSRPAGEMILPVRHPATVAEGGVAPIVDLKLQSSSDPIEDGYNVVRSSVEGEPMVIQGLVNYKHATLVLVYKRGLAGNMGIRSLYLLRSSQTDDAVRSGLVLCVGESDAKITALSSASNSSEPGNTKPFQVHHTSKHADFILISF